mgnify:CR=1 FL=1
MFKRLNYMDGTQWILETSYLIVSFRVYDDKVALITHRDYWLDVENSNDWIKEI